MTNNLTGEEQRFSQNRQLLRVPAVAYCRFVVCALHGLCLLPWKDLNHVLFREALNGEGEGLCKGKEEKFYGKSQILCFGCGGWSLLSRLLLPLCFFSLG